MWHLPELLGKYYGTIAEHTETGERVVFWNGFDYYTPEEVSEREKADGWEPEHGYNHVESQRDYEMALRFVENENKFERGS